MLVMVGCSLHFICERFNQMKWLLSGWDDIIIPGLHQHSYEILHIVVYISDVATARELLLVIAESTGKKLR